MKKHIDWKRVGWTVGIIAVLLLSVASCNPNPIETIKGELFSQEIDDGFLYDIATYTLETNHCETENGTVLQFYTFKVRDGHELILGKYYIFKVRFIDNGEFVLESIDYHSSEEKK